MGYSEQAGAIVTVLVASTVWVDNSTMVAVEVTSIVVVVLYSRISYDDYRRNDLLTGASAVTVVVGNQPAQEHALE